MHTVRQILQGKGQQVWSVGPQDMVYVALEKMAQHGIGALLVMEDDRLIGIFSERDYARKVILQGRSSKTTPVRELMTTKVYYVDPDRSTEECMQLMTSCHIRHLPVVENSKVVGVISIGDVVKSLLQDREATIRQLESYISGPNYPG
jgi:CBS domain-containing protein